MILARVCAAIFIKLTGRETVFTAIFRLYSVMRVGVSITHTTEQQLKVVIIGNCVTIISEISGFIVSRKQTADLAIFRSHEKVQVSLPQRV